MKKGISKKVNLVLRKIVSTEEGTAGFANVDGYEVGEKQELLKKRLMEFILIKKLILLQEFFQYQSQIIF